MQIDEVGIVRNIIIRATRLRGILLHRGLMQLSAVAADDVTL